MCFLDIWHFSMYHVCNIYVIFTWVVLPILPKSLFLDMLHIPVIFLCSILPLWKKYLLIGLEASSLHYVCLQLLKKQWKPILEPVAQKGSNSEPF